MPFITEGFANLVRETIEALKHEKGEPSGKNQAKDGRSSAVNERVSVLEIGRIKGDMAWPLMTRAGGEAFSGLAGLNQGPVR